MAYKERKLGRFKVSLHLMRGATIGEGQNLFKDMIIFDNGRRNDVSNSR